MFTIVITGSREFNNYEILSEEMRSAFSEGDLFIVGDARGVDRAAIGICAGEGWSYMSFKADWKRYGRGAGHIRNDEMLDQNPDLVLAFWDGSSPGTKSMIDKALFRGINLKVVFDNERESSV